MTIAKTLLGLLALASTVEVARADGHAGPDSMTPIADLPVGTVDSGRKGLGTLVDTSKPTVIHLMTDYCAITDANLAELEKMAEAHGDINFVAVLRYLQGTDSTEYECESTRMEGYCTSDDGATLAEEAKKVTKVMMVQDLFKPETGKPKGCADEISNCADNAESMGGGDAGKKMVCEHMGADCKKFCGQCPAEEETAGAAAPAFEPPLCCVAGGECNSCGGIWNMYGSTGTLQSAWDLKEQVIAYSATGCRVGFVEGKRGEKCCDEKQGKLWDEAKIAKIAELVAAAKDATGSCGGAGGGGGGGGDAKTGHDEHGEDEHHDEKGEGKDDHDGQDHGKEDKKPKKGCEPEEAPAKEVEAPEFTEDDLKNIAECQTKCAAPTEAGSRRLFGKNFRRLEDPEAEAMCKMMDCMKGEEVCASMMKQQYAMPGAKEMAECMCSTSYLTPWNALLEASKPDAKCDKEKVMKDADGKDKALCDAPDECKTLMVDLMKGMEDAGTCGAMIKEMRCGLTEKDEKCLDEELEGSVNFAPRKAMAVLSLGLSLSLGLFAAAAAFD